MLDTISLGGRPEAVATGAGLVWVTDRADNTVKAIDPSSFDVVATIDVGADPAWVAADGDTDLWVANRTGGTLTKIDMAGRKAVGTFDVGPDPGEVAVDADNVWVASEV